MNNLFVKKGDNVMLLAGKNKGKTGKILAVNPDSGRVVVDGRNVITKHVKARTAQDKGGIQKIPGSIDASNVQVICPSCSVPTRIAAGVSSEGKRVRLCKKCGASLDVKQKVDKKAKKSKKDEALVAEEKPVKKAKKDDTTAVSTEEKPASKPAAKKTTTKAPAENKAAESKEE